MAQVVAGCIYDYDDVFQKHFENKFPLEKRLKKTDNVFQKHFK